MAHPNVIEAKRLLRAQLKQTLALLTPARRTQWSAQIVQHILAWETWQKAQSVMLFYPTTKEPDIQPLFQSAIDSGKTLTAPRMDWYAQSMRPVHITSPQHPTEVRHHDIREPIESDAIEPGTLDLILVPGLGFDPLGGRLGHGAGYYDRFISSTHSTHTGRQTITLGVCFGCQVCSTVPMTDHDQRVDALVTELSLVLPPLTRFGR